jgi:hypothetical protein
MPSGVSCQSVNGAVVENKDGDNDDAGSSLLAGIFFIITFFALCIIKKIFLQ